MLNNLKNTLGNIAGSFFGSKAGETSSQPKEDTVKLVTNIATDVSYVIEYLLKLHSCKSTKEFGKHINRGALSYLASLKDKFVLLKNKLNEAEKVNPSIKNFGVIKFCRSITENDKLSKELSNFSTKCGKIRHITDYKKLYSQLNKIITDFEVHQLQKKISFLNKLEGKSDFSLLSKEYKNGWEVYDLLIDEDFRQYVDKTIVNDCIKSANHGEDTARKYFGDAKLQAYYTKADDDTRNILNINLIDRGSRSEPTQISDILQQEKDVHELNIYCNKKHEVRARKYEDNTRNYEFEKGANYEMTSTWPVKDESGKVSMCTMVMNVGNGGITKILKLNDGEESEFQREDILELARKNSELRIQGCFLYDAINKYWGVQTGESLRAIAKVEKGKEPDSIIVPDVVPVADRALQNDKATIPASNDKQDPEDGSGSAGSTLAAHTASDSEAIIPNQDPSSQGSDLATVNDALNKEREALKKEVSRLNTKNMEFAQEAGAVLQVMKQQCTKMKTETQVLHVELEENRAENNKLSKEFDIQKQTNEGLEDKLEKLSVENGNLRTQIQEVKTEKDKLNTALQENTQRLQDVEEEKEGLKSKLRAADKSNEDERNQLNQELEKHKQMNGRLEIELKESSQENSDLQAALEKKKQEIKTEKDKTHSLNTVLQEKTQEFEVIDKEKEGLEGKLRAANKSNKELESELEKSKGELDQAWKDAYHTVEENNDTNSKRIQNLNSQMLKLEQWYKEQLKCSAERIGELRWKITELENILKMRDKKLKFYEQELKESHKEAKDLDDQLKGLNEMLSKGSEENEDLREIIADKVQEIEKLQHELKLIEEDLECTSNKLQRNEKDGSSPELSENLKSLLKSSELIEGLSLIGDVFLPLKKQLSRSASLELCDSGFGSGQDSRIHSPTAPNSPTHKPHRTQVTRTSSHFRNSGSNWREKVSGNKVSESRKEITCGGR